MNRVVAPRRSGRDGGDSLRQPNWPAPTGAGSKRSYLKVVYLIQSDCRDHPFEIPSGSEVLLLQWQEDFEPVAHSIHLPGCTWAEGRNELYRRASQGSFDYFIFCDDDMGLRFHWQAFESLLRQHEPWRATAIEVNHEWNRVRRGAIDRVKYVDHAIMAVRADCATELMPYTTEHDATCWWLNSEAFCERCWRLRPWGTLRFNQLEYENLQHRIYPREQYPGLPRNRVRAFRSGWWFRAVTGRTRDLLGRPQPIEDGDHGID